MTTSTLNSMTRRSAMMAAILLTNCVLHAYPPSFSEGLVQVQDVAASKWGYMDTDGKWVLPAKVDGASSFNSGRAIISSGEKRVVIDKRGKVQFELTWAVPNNSSGYFFDGMLRITKDGKSGYLDVNGKVVVSPQYDDAKDFSFSEGLAAVCKDGKWGYIDTKGENLGPLEWDSADSFRHGFAVVQRDRKFGFIDRSGKLVTELKYHQVRDYGYGIALVTEEKKQNWSVIKCTGERLTEPKWVLYPKIVEENRIIFQEGNSDTGGNGLWGLADSEGLVLVAPKWERVAVGGFGSGMACAYLPEPDHESGGKAGYINRDGKVVIPFKYESALWFTDGRAFATLKDKMGYIDETGEFAFEIPK